MNLRTGTFQRLWMSTSYGGRSTSWELWSLISTNFCLL